MMKKKSKFVIGWFPVILLLLGLSSLGTGARLSSEENKRGLSKCDHEGCFESLTQKTGCRVFVQPR